MIVLAFCVASAPSAAASSKRCARATVGHNHKHHKRFRCKKRTRTTRAATQLSVSTLSPTNGQTVSGSINWQVAVSETPKRVDFAVDGSVRWSQSASPYLYGGSGGSLDTKTLSNGSHTLTATAFGSRGAKASSKVTVTVANTVPPPPPADPPPPPPDPAPSSVYWGAQISDHLTGIEAPWDMNAVSQFEQMAGRPLSMVHFARPFANCSSSPCNFIGFPTTQFEAVRQHGAIPFFSWASQSTPSSLNEPNFQLSDVIAGTYDSYIQSFATSAKNWGHPFFLRFNFEMNGNWFPWSEGANGNGPGQYVAAWRHVHDIFTSVGATNATWTWCPNVDPNNNLQSLGSLYPGDSYVDWTCLDGYNWGTNPSRPVGWKTFDQLYDSTYHQIADTIAPTKPMVIGEVGSTEYGGSKAAWIQDMLDKIPTDYSKIRALLWFERYDDGMDWPIETSSTATSAFSNGVKGPAYTSNSYSSLPPGPVQPPSA
jgi:hypothetical protein